MIKSNHKFVSKDWGYEIWVENNPLYCCKHLHIVPEKWCSFHYHKDKKETFYVIGGELLLIHAPYSEDLAQEIKTLIDPRLDWGRDRVSKSNFYYKFKTEILKKGDSLTIETGIIHTFTTSLSIPCDFVEASTRHSDSDSYRLYK